MSHPHDRSSDGSLPLGVTARSAKAALTGARQRIFARLRAAPVIPVAPPPVRSCEPPLERAVLLRQFTEALSAAQAELHVTDSQNWPSLLLRLAVDKQVRSLLIGKGSHHGQRLIALNPDRPRLLSYDRPAPAWKSELFDQVDAGFTAARCAIADTGSLVLWPDATEPRLLSLVPPIHFVLLDAATLQPSLRSVMASETWSQGLPTNALLISGPSKTADIQQTLAYGAHGPKQLIVLVSQS